MSTGISASLGKKEYVAKLQELSLPAGAKFGVVLLHGLTGMPNEMRPVAKALESIGCQVNVPMLPGHGATFKELLATGWKDWLRGARDAFNELSATCDHVFVVGLSMGSLFPVLLCAEDLKVAGIVALSPTIKYDSRNSSNPFQCLLPLVDWLWPLARFTYWTEAPPYGLKDERLQRLITKQLEAAKAQGGKTDFGQFRTYSGSLRQLQLLVKQVKKHGCKVKCPVLIMHSLEDTITTPWNAEQYKSWLGTADKELILLEGCDHVLTLDLKKEEVAYRTAEFICRVAADLVKQQ